MDRIILELKWSEADLMSRALSMAAEEMFEMANDDEVILAVESGAISPEWHENMRVMSDDLNTLRRRLDDLMGNEVVL